MKRRFTAALGALLALGLVSVSRARPAAAAVRVPSVDTPTFVAPDLPPGFEPISPDEFGFSPNFKFFVFEDGDNLHVLRAVNNRELFRMPSEDLVSVGFDPFDQRLFTLERRGDGITADYRFRLIDPVTGTVLLNRSTIDRPEIRTNFDATANLLVTRGAGVGRAEVINFFGQVTARLSLSPTATWGMSANTPAVVFVNSLGQGQTEFDVVNAQIGRLVYRYTVNGLYSAGFDPFGFSFVIGESTSIDTFRVKLIRVPNGRILLNRSFEGALNVGFTPDGRLLGVKSGSSLDRRLDLFRTSNGTVVPTR